MGVGLGQRRRRCRREVYRLGRVAVPVAPAELPRVVRMRERDDKEERLGPGAACEVEELPHRGERDLVVVVLLQARLAPARTEDALHGVVPGELLAGSAAPVRRPVEAGRIDVGGEPFLEAVELIGADEVHLAGQAGGVAVGSQMVRQRWSRRRELRAVVVNAGPRRQPAREHRGARRCAQWGGAVCAVEHHPVACQRRDGGRLDDRVSVGRQPGSRQLVDHDQQEVRAGHRRRSCRAQDPAVACPRATSMLGVFASSLRV